MHNRQVAIGVFVLCIVALAGCGGGDDKSDRNGPRAGASATGTAGADGKISDGNTNGNAGAGGDPVGPGPEIDPNAPPFVRDDTGMGMLDPATLDGLKKASGACGATLQYPYDGTVFPGALPAPTIMWKEESAAAYVHVTYEGSKILDYEFATGPTKPGELTIPQDAWNEITRRTTGGNLNLTLNLKIGDAFSSCQMHWSIAPGNMSGAVYYNSYNAPNAINFNQGAVMRLTLGQLMPEIYLQYQGTAMSGTGPCISCHSISHDGSTIAASTHDYGMNKSFEVHSYPLVPAPQPAPTSVLDNAVLGALTRDGARILTMGNPDCTNGADTFPRASNNFPLVEGPDVARVQDAKTGKDIPAEGLKAEWYMWMPQFSPDGKHVVFNHAKPDGKGGTDRRELAMMDYDAATNKFSNLQVLISHLGPEPTLAYNPAGAGAGKVMKGRNGCAEPGGGGMMMYGGGGYGGNTAPLNPGTCEGPCYPAYPFFTPDSKGVVFSLMSEPDFTNAFPGRDHPAKSDLWYVDTATKTKVRLDAASDPHDPSVALAEYFPTVMPIAVGGYYWVFWTSRRAYGNKTTGLDPATIFSGGFPSLDEVLKNGTGDTTKKRIWVSAITPPNATEIAAGTLKDPSHPGFYLPGQSNSGNVRAFATLNPCKMMGETCESGIDCCGGYCDTQTKKPGVCTDQKPKCSATNDKCTTDADCCPAGLDEEQNTCIGGFCSYVVDNLE